MADQRFAQPVPVLMLHDVDPPGRSGRDPYAIDADALARLLDLLQELGLHTATPEELLSGDARQPAVMITFDDARTGVLEQALPLLAARGQRGVVYAISGRTGRRPGFLDGEGLCSLARAGWTIGSHTVSHRHLTGLTRVELAEEWRRSRAELEEVLRRPVLHGSLPGGRGRAREQEEARRAGLTSLATSVPGLWRSTGERFAIPRLTVRGDPQRGRLALALSGDLRWLLAARARHFALGLLKQVLGDRTYDRLRQRLLGVGAGEEG